MELLVLSFSSGPGVNFNQTSNIKCFYNVRLEWIILKASSKFFYFYSSYIFFFSYLFVRQKICSFPSFLLLHLRSIDEKSTICLVWNKISRRSLGVVKYDFIDSCTYFLCVTLESEELSYHIFPNKKLK